MWMVYTETNGKRSEYGHYENINEAKAIFESIMARTKNDVLGVIVKVPFQ